MSARPAKPLLLKPATSHLGSAGLGEPALAIIDAWGSPADMTGNIPHLRSSAMIWMTGKVAWAVAAFNDPAQEHASSLFYRGPFRSLRNDRKGTPLALVVKHWPHHSRPEASRTLRGYTVVTIAHTRLLFDRSRRLTAIAAGTELATELSRQ
jgi:hypothetical protein